MKRLTNPLVVVVGIGNYGGPPNDVNGIDKDIATVRQFCNVLNYKDILTNVNSTVKDVNDLRFNILARARGHIDACQRNDGLIFFYSGHGNSEGMVLSNNGVYPWHDIFDYFNSKQNNCPYLADKPKIFVIDACRGNQRAQSINLSVKNGSVNVMSGASLEAKSGKVLSLINGEFHPDSSFSMFFANTNKYVSFQDNNKGGCLIRAFCHTIMSCIINLRQNKKNEENKVYKEMSLHEMIVNIRKGTKINAGILGWQRNDNYTQLMEYRGTLEYNIYFGQANDYNSIELFNKRQKKQEKEYSALKENVSKLQQRVSMYQQHSNAEAKKLAQLSRQTANEAAIIGAIRERSRARRAQLNEINANVEEKEKELKQLESQIEAKKRLLLSIGKKEEEMMTRLRKAQKMEREKERRKEKEREREKSKNKSKDDESRESESGWYQCRFCNWKFESRVDLVKHENSHVNSSKHLQCVVCKKKFNRNDIFKTHVKICQSKKKLESGIESLLQRKSNVSPNIWKLGQWVDEYCNNKENHGPIYGPIVKCVNVKDFGSIESNDKVCHHLITHIGLRSLSSFIVTNSHDYSHLRCQMKQILSKSPHSQDGLISIFQILSNASCVVKEKNVPLTKLDRFYDAPDLVKRVINDCHRHDA